MNKKLCTGNSLYVANNDIEMVFKFKKITSDKKYVTVADCSDKDINLGELIIDMRLSDKVEHKTVLKLKQDSKLYYMDEDNEFYEDYFIELKKGKWSISERIHRDIKGLISYTEYFFIKILD